MQKTLLILSLLLSVSPAFAADKTCANKQTVAIVDGMVCDFCAQGMIKTFKKNEAVSDVKIDLTTKNVTIDMKANKEITDAEIAKLVDYSGYKLVKIDHACKKG